MFNLMSRNQYRESRKMRKQVDIFQTKEQDKFPETNLNEIEISDLLSRKFKTAIIKMLTEVRRAMCEQSENSNKEMEINKKKYQKEIIVLKNTIIELKHLVKGFNIN